MTAIRIGAKALKAVSRISAKQDIRYYLNGVYVEATKDGTVLVATDGHKLLAVHQKVGNDIEGERISIIIPTSVVKLLTGKASKSQPWIEIEQDGDKWVALAPPDFELQISFKPIEGKFPDWRRVIPESASGESASYQAQYIRDLQDAAMDLSSRGMPTPISITHNGHAGGMVTCPNLTDYGFVGVIMPMHGLAMPYEKRPEWAAKLPEPEPEVAPPPESVKEDAPAEEEKEEVAA